MAKILELRVDNFRRISAVEIRPDGSLVVISGANTAGKTSVLHAIWAAFKGRAVAGPTPIRKGAESCTIRCQTDEFTVTRSFKHTKDGELTTDLKLVMTDGRKIDRKPQAMLDALLPDLALDPLDFMRRPVKDQVDTLKGLVRGFDFAANTKARDEAFALRTTANRRRDESHAAAEAIVLPDGPEPKPIDTSALVDDMAKAAAHNADIENRKARREQAQTDINTKLDEAEQLRARAATLERDAKALQTKLDAAEPLPAPIDVAKLRATIATAETTKAIIDKFTARRQYLADEAKHMATSVALTQAIADLDAAKRAAVADTALPVGGLVFDDEQILLGGVPFEQASLAEKLRASVGIGIALCPPNPEPALRIMTIDEGSELDDHSLALLAELADVHGYQVWVARVQPGAGFVIEDGHLAGAAS
jgi:DNA repair exonuclease SbcCD ATPase subunit